MKEIKIGTQTMNLIIKIKDIHNEDVRVMMNSVIAYQQAGQFIVLQTASGPISFIGNIDEFDDRLEQLTTDITIRKV